MSNWFQRVEAEQSHLRAGLLAYVEDIHSIQDRAEDAMSSNTRDLHGKSHIIGSQEETFMMTPAEKIKNQYIDQYNENSCSEEDFRWIPIWEMYIRQKISINKTEIKNVFLKLRNLTDINVDVTFEITDISEDMIPLGIQTIRLPKNTTEEEFQISFDLDYIPVGDYYLVIKAINLNTSDLSPEFGENELIDWDSHPLAVLYDYRGNYNKSLKVSFTGDQYEPFDVTTNQKEYFPEADLWFRTEYGGGYTYDVEPGIAQIDGEKVFSLQSHVSIDKGSDEGNRTDLVVLTKEGLYEVISSETWLIDADEVKPEVDIGALEIAYLTIYQNDNKPIKIDQNDTQMITRKRSHHERLRRLEKQMEFSLDRNTPGRIKYNISGKDLQDTSNEANIVLTTNAKGEPVFTTTVVNEYTQLYHWAFKDFVAPSKIAITSNMSSIEKQHAIDHNALIDANIKLGLYNNPTDGMFEKAGGCTFNNIAADYTVGQLKLAVEKETPIYDTKTIITTNVSNNDKAKKAYIVRRGATMAYKTGGTISQWPAYAFTPTKDVTLSTWGLDAGTMEFKNMKNVKISIMTRDPKQYCVKLTGKNCGFENPYNSSARDLTSLTSDSKGIKKLSKNIVFNVNKKLKKGQQYIIFVYGELIKGKNTGIIYLNQENITKANKNIYSSNGLFRRDGIIKYKGPYYSGLPNSFRLDKLQKQWSFGGVTTTTTSKVVSGYQNQYFKEGSITSQTLTLPGSEAQILGASFNGGITTPSGCSYRVEVSNNGGQTWITMANNLATFSTRSNQFKWRIILISDTKGTPEIKYSSTNKYALRFALNVRTTTETPNPVPQEKETCLTTVPFNGDKIIRDVLGDAYINYYSEGNINQYNSKFNSFEFARIYAEEFDGKIVIDINAADYTMLTGSNQVLVNHWSTIITDLNFDDFKSESVDLTYYEEDLEYDERNYRFKLETDKMYNDSDVVIEPASGKTTEWGDINSDKFEDNEIGYETIDTNYFGKQTQASIKTLLTEFGDKVIMGKRYEETMGLDLTKYRYLNLNISIPVAVKTEDKITTTLPSVPANTYRLVLSKNIYGQFDAELDSEGNVISGSGNVGYSLPISEINRGEIGNNIKLDISRIAYDLGNIKSIGLITKADELGDLTYVELLRINYISGSVSNISSIIPKNGNWTVDTESRDLNIISTNINGPGSKIYDFALKGIANEDPNTISTIPNLKLPAKKLAIFKTTHNFDQYNFIRYNIEVCHIKGSSGSYEAVGGSDMLTPIKGVFWFDLCSDTDGNNVIESIPVPTILSVGSFDNMTQQLTPLTTTIFKKIGEIGVVKSIVFRTIGTDTNLKQNFYIKINDFTGLTAESLPLVHNTMRMKIYPVIDSGTVYKPEIRKAGVIIKL